MKIIVIGSRDSGTKNDPQALGSSLKQAGESAEVIYWEDLVFSISTGKVDVSCGGRRLLEQAPDLLIAVGWYKSGKQSIYRDVAFSLALFLQENGIAFWNSEMARQRSTTKLSCLVQLALSGIPVSATKFSLTAHLALDHHPLPFVAKAASASRGRSNFLVEILQDMEKLSFDDTYYLVQPFLENDHDLRVICFANKPQLVLKRSRGIKAKTHVNNTSQGGSAQWMALESIDAQLLTISSKICKIMGREMAGIDFIPDKSSPFGYSCLEVNAIPQLTSGYDTDKKLQAFLNAVKIHIKDKAS